MRQVGDAEAALPQHGLEFVPVQAIAGRKCVMVPADQRVALLRRPGWRGWARGGGRQSVRTTSPRMM